MISGLLFVLAVIAAWVSGVFLKVSFWFLLILKVGSLVELWELGEWFDTWFTAALYAIPVFVVSLLLIGVMSVLFANKPRF